MEGIKSYKFANNVLGWIVFTIALVTYTLTMEKSGSFWDCGEFVSCAYKLQVAHPPGAPVFNIFGRVFSLFAFGNVENVAMMVNFLSALSTAFVVLFCFWTTTALVRKFLLKKEENYTSSNILATLGAGLVAGLTCTFMDSLWFSAGEGEVYALSMFFMAFVVWATLKWDADDSPYADRWLLLIAFMIGLSTGVHLLSMLAIPFLAIIFYLKKFKFSVVGLIIAFGLSFITIGFIMKGVIAGIPGWFASFDKVFVNSFGLPFNTGVVLCAVIMVVALAALVYASHKNMIGITDKIWNSTVGGFIGKHYKNTDSTIENRNGILHKISLCLLFLVIGYSSFIMVPIRSEANTPINMNRPTDPFKMLSYLNREQYGERPLLFGPDYTVEAQRVSQGGDIVDVVENGIIWNKNEKTGKYENLGPKQAYEWSKESKMFFPRLGVINDGSKVEAYRSWIQPDYLIYDKETKQTVAKYANNQLSTAEAYLKEMNTKNESAYGSNRYRIKDELSWGDNIKFFFQYQIGYMYMRYFMWNFSGRQNDTQGKYNNSEGGWITGINLIDNNIEFWGNPSWTQTDLSPIRAENKANNKFYAIPFLLGLIGILFLFDTNWKLGLATLIMFLATGLFFIVYGNQPPIEPRERDYALVGSFFAYAIWIGIAVVGMYKAFKKLNPTAGAIIATCVGLVAPILMGTQGWDDHNRSGRTVTIDFATNYLESCAPNAVIFTQGDNDTYPLWYAQEVEGVRTDVRVVNLSLLGVDWYVNQLRYKMNDADPLKLTFSPEQIQSGNRDYVRYLYNPKIDENKFYDAKQIMNFVATDRPEVAQKIGDSYYIPSRKLSFPISAEAVSSMNMLEPDTNGFLPELQVQLNKANLLKNDLMTVDIIANNINERPIYFAVSVSPSSYLGFQKYFQQEGLTYRIVPKINPSGSPTESPVRTDVMKENMVEKFKWGQIAENPSIYLDENIMRMTLNLVSNFSKLAEQMVAEGDKAEASAVIDKCLAVLPPEKINYNFFHGDFPSIYLANNEKEKATALAENIHATTQAELDYYVTVFNDVVADAKKNGHSNYLQQLAQGAFRQNRDIAEQLYLLQRISQSFASNDSELSKKYQDTYSKYETALRSVN